MNTWKRAMSVIDRHRGRNALRQDVTSFNASQASRACFSQMARDYRARSFLEYRTGSWSELDGPKTLNTETCRTTAVADRLLDTAVIYTGTVYMRVVYTPADYTVADCTEVGQTRGGCHGRVASRRTTGHGTQAQR
ncbi:uncharacterized protein LOC143894090 [Temnothorax americanus]|uniref:uncharacterized protein LOC143894090 n=1 Tax=Temnothorax americanus TaxID=1964332 RepID=UPI004068E663